MAIVSSILGYQGGSLALVQKGSSVLSLAAATKAILKPQSEVEGIDNLVFSIPETESLQLQAQITDHVVEDNSSMQDHVAISPIKVTLTGKISELTLTKSKLQKYAESVINVLSSVPFISPKLSASALSVLSTAQQTQQAIEQTTAKIQSVSDFFTGKATLNKQQQYYTKLKQMFASRGLFTVRTPWETLTNMVIESVSFDQDETTQEWTTVSVTLKQVTLAKTKELTKDIKGRIAVQKAAVAEKGKASNKTLFAEGVDAGVKGIRAIFGF